ALLLEHLLAAIGELLQRLVEARLLGPIDLLQGAPQIAARVLSSFGRIRLGRLGRLSALLLLAVAVLAACLLHVLQRLVHGFEGLREWLASAFFALACLAARRAAAR